MSSKPFTLCLALLLVACSSPVSVQPYVTLIPLPTATATAPIPVPVQLAGTPLPAGEPFPAGEAITYTVQGGDTVQTLAIHFNTTTAEILARNPTLPFTTTLTPGQEIYVPSYWYALAGTPYQILPDSDFTYGPGDADFDAAAFIAAQPGYLKHLSEFVAERQRDAAETLMYVARTYSVSPRLLLALMEWRTGALTEPNVPLEVRQHPFGPLGKVKGYYAQLRHVAGQLSLGYYSWRNGELTALLLRDSTTSRPYMTQNAGTVAVHYLFAQWFDNAEFQAVTAPTGFGATYIRLFGDPFQRAFTPILPGDFTQPELTLPFAPGQIWAFTGGPHPAWGEYTPWAAMDFAPAGIAGCVSTDKWAAAVAPGVIVRSGENTAVLDLDGDGLEQTGWVLVYFHLDDFELIAPGTKVNTGDPIGHPSCEGGSATGTHIHLSRKYNGEWIPADGVIAGIAPFTLGGWIPQRGAAPYLGRMTRIGQWVEACTCSTARNTVYWVKEEGE